MWWKEFPLFVKDYDIEERTLDNSSVTQTYTNESGFSHISTFKKFNLNPSGSTIDQRMMRMYMRVWSGLQKLILKVVSEGNCFVSLNIGYFFPLKGIQGSYGYSPTVEILEKYGFVLLEDAHNINPNHRFVIQY